MKKIIYGGFFLFSILMIFSFINQNEDREMVYACDSRETKCYYKFPCKKLSTECGEENRIFKISLERAKLKELVDCECYK